MELQQFVLIGNPGTGRVDAFQAALEALGHPPARVVSYIELIESRVRLGDVARPGAVVRIESPDRSLEVEKAILHTGADLHDEEGDYARASHRQIDAIPPDKGAILYPRQWYLGYRQVLGRIEAQLLECPQHRLMNHPRDIAAMFDKPLCHALFTRNGLPVPQGLGPVHSYDELVARMHDAGLTRVFVKLAHGSSALGVVAYATGKDRHMAVSTVEMTSGTGGELRLYNSRRLRTYRDPREIATLIDELCRHRVHVERWLPKAGLDGRTLDVRVLVIGGRVRHVVVRLGRGVVTNLHLAPDRTSGRTTLNALLTRLHPAAWEAARRTCEQAMELFPDSLYGGVDLLVTSDYRRHAIAEINAFGDQLYGAVDRGEDTYTAEIRALLEMESEWVEGANEKENAMVPVEAVRRVGPVC